jgi:hypothetical protein
MWEVYPRTNAQAVLSSDGNPHPTAMKTDAARLTIRGRLPSPKLCIRVRIARFGTDVLRAIALGCRYLVISVTRD